MAVSEAHKRASMRYDKENMRQIKFNLSKKYNLDIISHLDSVPNKQGYIKDLIRADMARAKSEPTQPVQNILKEDKTMTYNSVIEPSNLFFDHDPARVIIRGDQSAQNPDDPGVPSGGNPWYAVQRDPSDDWSTGSFDLEEAKALARKYRDDPDYGAEDPLIAVIDNALEHPFCTEEIRDFD